MTMKNYLIKLSKNAEGKKLLLSLDYASKSPLSDNTVLSEYLSRLKDGVDVSVLRLKQKTFDYKGKLVHILGRDIFEKYYVDNDRPSGYLKVDPIKTNRKISKYNEEDREYYQGNMDIESFKYGEKLGSGGFVWCTKLIDHHSVSPSQLGVAHLNGEDLLQIEFPLKNYSLYYPLAIEGYGDDKRKGWHYGNINSNENWGCTIDIDNVEINCDEKDMRGLPEALLKIVFSEEHTVKYVDKEIKDDKYFDIQYTTFLNRIDTYFDLTIIDNIMENIIKGKA